MHDKFRRISGSTIFQRKALALAIGGSVALAVAGGAFAQAVNGTIEGRVPIASGEAIQIIGGAGYNRTITVGPSGKYSVTLPVGTYTVNLLQDGQVIKSRTDVSPAAGGAVTVDFTSTSASPSATLAAINVSANSIPPIDVTTTNQVTTITAKQLQQLPIGRTAESIALLAPGVTPAAALLNNGPLNSPLLIFGGASAAENAYYIDGMNTTDALTGQGGVDLPYGAIQQQQTFTSGYGAKYGRSIGGVINQIGKSGSNTWHFGAQAQWNPAPLRSSYVNQFYRNPRSTTPGQESGDLRTYRKDNSRMETVYDAYVSGPIVKDKLFFFLAAEQDRVGIDQVTNKNAPFMDRYRQHYPKLYAKINWNINSSNFLTVTGVSNSYKEWEDVYDYDYDTYSTGDFSSLGQTTKNSFRTWVANYTSYITDNLTLHAMLGKTHGEYYTQQPAFPGFDPGLPHIGGSSVQNPAFIPNGPVVNSNPSYTMGDPSHRDTVQNYRIDLDYKLGNHDLSFGIDNVQTWDINDGDIMTGPGYAWIYQQGDPGKPIVGSDPGSAPYVGPPDANGPNPDGYYVDKYIFNTAAGVRVSQRAQYIQDEWQVTPNLLLSLGLRNDQFINYNPAGEPYIRLTKPQWAPRLGFSWNVFGDSTMKVFGNAGRYYLALPAAVALRGAGASLYTRERFTYTGIDQTTGEPTGLTQIPQNNGGHPGLGVSANNEYGQPLDPRTVSSQNIKAEYSDNFVLGMQKQFQFLDTEWVFGATGIYQKLGRIVDDWNDQTAICEAAVAQGFQNFAANGGCGNTAGFINGSVLINPGEESVLLVNDPDGVSLDRVVISPADQKFERPPIRKYYGLTLSLAHQWDGKWFAKVDYTFSRNWGNTEGPLDSIIGQDGSSVSITEQWDFWQLMQGSYGLQPNDQRHQFKVYGAYAISPEWTVGGNLFIASGHPNICLGSFGPDETQPNGGYGNAYHWCGGVLRPPGSTGSTPWTHQLSLNANYQPAWAGHKLNFNVAVFNVFNNQTATQYYYAYGTRDTPNTNFGLVQGWTAPRSVRFTMSYDW